MKKFLWAAVILVSNTSLAWGPRGHSIVTRCAVHLLAESPNHTFGQNLLNQELYLSFLSNAPDHYWRSPKVSKRVRSENSPTHYLNAETYMAMMGAKSVTDALTKGLSKKQTFAELKDSGSAPQRIIQLKSRLESQLHELQKNKNVKKMDWVIVTTGILSHFIGDLANPMHVAGDYDGWQANQGGLHAYFESDIVSSYSLKLEGEACQSARDLFAKTKRPLKDYRAHLIDFIQASRDRLPTIFELDRIHSLLKESTNRDGLRIPAQRKPARDVQAAFKKVIVERLAQGAVMLALTWDHAWVQAGSPAYPDYLSYNFEHTPKFITPDY